MARPPRKRSALRIVAEVLERIEGMQNSLKKAYPDLRQLPTHRRHAVKDARASLEATRVALRKIMSEEMSLTPLTPPRHRTPWTEEDVAHVTELVRQGRSNREIASSIGRTEATTGVMLARLQIDRGQSSCLSCRAPLEQPTVGRKRMYCGERCRTAEERQRRRSDREATVDPDLRCRHCDGPIPVDRQLHSASVMYCSRACSQGAWYARERAKLRQG